MVFGNPFDILKTNDSQITAKLSNISELSEEEKKLFDPNDLSFFFDKPMSISSNFVFGPLQVYNNMEPYYGSFELQDDVWSYMKENEDIVPVIFCISSDTYNWPIDANFYVNTKRYKRPDYRLTNESEKFWINIKESVKKGKNKFQVHVDSNITNEQRFIIGIRLFSMLSNSKLAKDVYNFEHTDLNHWKDLFRYYLSNEKDAIMSNNICLSLCCPIGLQKITDAVRGVNCMHLLCFDLITYLRFTRECGQWKCPICGKNCYIKDLRCDDFVQEIINSVPQNCESVIINEKGQYAIDKIRDFDEDSD